MNPVAGATHMPVMAPNLLVGLPPVAAHHMIHGVAPVAIPPAPPAEVTGSPNNTLYIRNLNEKIKRDELKKSLYAVFVQFGQILDIITSRTLKMRGQAFVVFDDVNSATTALRAMQSFPLYEKPMRIEFAKGDSDIIAKRKGTYVARPKALTNSDTCLMDIRPNHTLYVNNLNDKVKKADLRKALYYLFGQHGRLLDIIAMKTMKMRGQAFIIYQDVQSATTALRSLQGFNLFQRPMRIAYAKRDSTQIVQLKGVSAEVQKRREEEREKRKRRKVAQRLAAAAAAAQAATQAANGPAGTGDALNLLDQPNHILFVTNLPEETTDAMLTMLFSQFSGFKEARRAPGGVWFVEYESAEQAAAARSAYEGFKLTPTHAMQISFAKK
ncbi:U1 small nuclear ribonucleoprotein A [Clonorchis sinensis]|uniref:U1 small nuclear ribonucleoprotein A n=2 Tax=Clonorchis sinensis TaxID=79923 RepID=A0A419PJ89_CLOSI|nr:U1 small nuclear ribonucleoprotein A [Clonorchis sinensis]